MSRRSIGSSIHFEISFSFQRKRRFAEPQLWQRRKTDVRHSSTNDSWNLPVDFSVEETYSALCQSENQGHKAGDGLWLSYRHSRVEIVQRCSKSNTEGDMSWRSTKLFLTLIKS
jgi:hypothetical protein